jgi:hypothetical protein
MREVNEATVIAGVVQRLTTTYAQVPADDVARAVDEALARFEGSRIREFVPLFVERQVRAQLAPTLTPSTAPSATALTAPAVGSTPRAGKHAAKRVITAKVRWPS